MEYKKTITIHNYLNKQAEPCDLAVVRQGEIFSIYRFNMLKMNGELVPAWLLETSIDRKGAKKVLSEQWGLQWDTRSNCPSKVIK